MTKRVFASSSQTFRFSDNTEKFSLPVEIFHLIWTTFLDPVSSVALAFTCRNFKQIIQPLLTQSKFCEKAAQLGYLKLIQWGVDQNCRWTSLASRIAAAGGYLPILQWAWDKRILDFEKTAIGAAEGNQVKVLEWLWEKGAILNADHANAAASHGHIELFQALKSKLGDKYRTLQGESIDPRITYVLIKSGNLTALKALFDKVDANKLQKEAQLCLQMAAELGNLECLKFLLNLVVNPKYNIMVHVAACGGYIEILDHILSDLQKRDVFTEEIAEWVAQEKRWDVIRWLITQGIKGNENASVYAARYNRWEELELMHNAQWPMSNRVCQCAAVYGHWELVKQLIKKGLLCEEGLLYFCAAQQGKVELLMDIKEGKLRVASFPGHNWNLLPLEMPLYKGDYDTYMKYGLAIGAAQSGNIEALAWVEKQGFEWQHELVTLFAAHKGNLEALQWLFQKGCPYKSEQLYEEALKKKHIHIIEWLIEIQVATQDERVGIEVAKSGKGDLLKKLVAQGCPVNARTIETAASAGHWDIVDWLNEQGCAWDIAFFEKAAAQGKEKILFSCLRQHFNKVNNRQPPDETLKLLYILAQYGHEKIFKDTVTTCIDKGIPEALGTCKVIGYGFDVQAVIEAARARHKKCGDTRALGWLKNNYYLK